MIGGVFVSHLKVDTRTLSGDAAEILGEFNAIEAKFNKMYEDVNALGSMWKGAANQQFEKSFAEDYEEIKQFMDILKKYALRLDDESDAYEDCENNVISLVQSI